MPSGTINHTLQISPGGVNTSEQLQALALTTNSTGDHEQSMKTTIATTEETIAVDAEIGDLGWVYLRNLDLTNNVEFGFATTVYPLKFKQSDVAFFRSATAATTFYVKFGTSPGLFLYRFWES